MWKFVEAVQFANIVGQTVATAKLTKSGGVQLVDDAGASSEQTISGDGYCEAVAIEVNSFRCFGLSDADGATTLADIVFGWYLKQDGTIEVRENGSVVASPGAYAAGDVFRVERVGSAIRYFRNGDLQHTSASTSSGPLRVDTTLLNIVGTPSTLDGLRLFDGTTKTWLPLTWQRATNVAITDGTPYVTRRQRALLSTNVRPGDLLIAVMGAQARDYVRASNVTWDEANASSTPNLRRGLHVFRRLAALGDPKELTFDLAIRHESIAALLVYRGVVEMGHDMYGIASGDYVATTVGRSPGITRARTSDLFIGAVFINNPSGVVVSTVSGATKRVEFQATGIAVAQRLAVIDGADHPVGLGPVSFGVNISGLPGGTSCAVGAVGVPGRPVPGSRLLLSTETPGAIGLPAEGI